VWLTIAALIWREDGDSPLFVQDRVGFRKRPFPIYKFRTMRDGRITRIGRVLRATGLDEIPQLINVLRGEMSLVGPRPLTPADVARLGWDGHAHALRWSVGPGITGLAQLYAGRGARLSWFLDRRYVESRRPRLDVAILALTMVIAMIGKRRVRGWLRRYSVRATVSGGEAGDCARRIRNGTLLTTPFTSAAKR
jgi:lipopolysaccharide/colanic/teichoic acid biosynthesis glycosyltransferase